MSLAPAPDHELVAWLAHSNAGKSGRTSSTYRRLKRALDLIVVLATAPIWVPVLLAGCLAVKLNDTSAPAFFVQQRTGRNGRTFNLIKLRTMLPGADATRVDLRVHFKIKDDPRVTTIGRHLRRFYVDELPQLVNVLRGEMSLVGPRPTSTLPNEYLLWQTERFEALPGLTCIWQLLADNYPTFDDRMRLDILYCRHWCLSLDLRLMTLTFAHVLRGSGS
jgi:lipopolysaccharide/colanic/teichoic acid biosynthesis glycosyltransferase